MPSDPLSCPDLAQAAEPGQRPELGRRPEPAAGPAPLAVRHRSWTTPPRWPRMTRLEDARPGVQLTNRCLLRHGKPTIPVSGELHFSRIPRSRWEHRLRQARAGGLTMVTSYVFWIHHVEQRGVPRFDGNRDVATFVDLCAANQLDLVLRIGPWCHGEVRNGGFPDWVQRLPVRHRTDDPGYLALVREWFAQLAGALNGRCSPSGSVLGLQLENELYDQPAHLVTLKRLAREAGMSAPLWLATAWGGAILPAEEVLPLYGGYGDGFWVDAAAGWHPSFRDHYFFSEVWDDPGIGADVRGAAGPTPPARTPDPLFPVATCELGGGMMAAYHRRPRPAALDVAAIAHCKIGNGSMWQGYYMYAGGTNPAGEHGLQESHKTGYPNDLPRLGYDFHAPIGEAGTLAASHAELRRQHAFLAAFGSRLADMPASLPDQRPHGVEDRDTLRWALRSDGREGFLFVAWHQPHEPLRTYRQARFRVGLDGDELVLPSRPVDIPPGTLARWPLRLTVGGVRVSWATASVLTVLPGEIPTLVLTADRGIPVELAVPSGTGDLVRIVAPGLDPLRVTSPTGALDVLVLPAESTHRIWVCEDGASRRLLLSDDELAWGPDGRVRVTSAGDVPQLLAYDTTARRFLSQPLALAGGVTGGMRSPLASQVAPVPAELVRKAASTVPAQYGRRDGRQSAPPPATFADLAGVYRLRPPAWAAAPELDALLRISWAGDVGQLRVDGRAVTDRFWDGSDWTISLRDAGYQDGSDVTVHLLPLATGSPVHLPADARSRLAAATGPLLALDAVDVIARRTWYQAPQ